MNFQHLLRLQRPLLWFDLETTGPNPRVDRIVEMGFIQFKPDGSIKEWRGLFNPEMPISPEATEKHGIDAARLLLCSKCGQDPEGHPFNDGDGDVCETFIQVPTFGQLASNLVRGFTDTDFAGFNIKNFDLPLMQAEFGRAGIADWKFDTAKILDSFRLWQVAEPRTLSDFYEKWMGKKLEDAHTALADIRGTMEATLALITTVQHLPRDIDQLHELLWPPRPRDPNWIDSTGKFIWINGVAHVNFGKKWNGKAMHIVQRRFWEWMVDPTQQFEPDAVQIARDMLAGRLPKPALPLEDASVTSSTDSQ